MRGVGIIFFAALLAISSVVLGCKDKDTEAAAAWEKAEKSAKRPEAPRELAPPFTVATLDGGTFRLEAVRGLPVVINFWASWCGPCRTEAPDIEKVYREFRGVGVEFIGIAVQDTPDNVRGFVRKYGITFKTGLDVSDEIAAAYGLTGVPQTFIVDRNGRLSHVHIGVISEDVLTEEIKKVL
jgi:cytochrome c biogenesis protein CcmG/thiol:disulfide interchange protein DsbE